MLWLLLVSVSSLSSGLNLLSQVHLPSLTVFSNFPVFRRKTIYRTQCVDFSPNSGFYSVANNKGDALLFRWANTAIQPFVNLIPWYGIVVCLVCLAVLACGCVSSLTLHWLSLSCFPPCIVQVNALQGLLKSRRRSREDCSVLACVVEEDEEEDEEEEEARRREGCRWSRLLCL